MKTMQFAAVAAALTAAALGSAIPAWAEPLDGSYTVTSVSDSDGRVRPGMKVVEVFSSCGQGCVHVQTAAPPDFDMHLQGSTWSGTYGGCELTLDANTLVRTDVCNGTTLHNQLTKNG